MTDPATASRTCARFATGLAAAAFCGALALPTCAQTPARAAATEFTLTSPTVADGGTLPAALVNNRYGCTGANHSPPLAWQHSPAGTRAFAVSVYDTDARGGKGWWHWIATGIPAKTSQLQENASSHGELTRLGAREGRTDFGDAGYRGPCPPVGDAAHHYIVTLYALDNDGRKFEMNLPPSELVREIEAHTIARATFVATYGRPAGQ
ncbi:Putative lipoprotein LppC [Pandoraea terrae]|uniref:Lipoprotein LppC n=1 Tax=Pandoraea terrae TaxID=1537710 RepID=A0A5E4Y9Z4_9BURK|nr:YbhB/YbcL family Raf kinase inhibitor-like protein [Pandoraea terrae]VVE45282.1 Putative lipoprotein LppC [Pandoraea terrae]